MKSHAIILAALALALHAEPKIEAVPDQGLIPLEYTKATDFSGITWLGGEVFYTVSNRDRAIFPLLIKVAEDGRLADAKFGARIPLRTDFDDLEGIAWQPEKERIYLASEGAAGVVGFDREVDARFAPEVPKVFQRARRNKGLESLTFGADAFWIANEGTLEGDGKPSRPGKGALVRLQKFDARWKPLAQFAYRTDASLVESATGLTDLCALADGRLLALERVMAAGLIAKIYLVDFTDATDTAEIVELDEDKIKVTGKKLLFERATGAVNFEGITLGPDLADGWRSLILIADSAGGHTHALLPLRIKLDAPAEK